MSACPIDVLIGDGVTASGLIGKRLMRPGAKGNPKIHGDVPTGINGLCPFMDRAWRIEHGERRVHGASSGI